MQSLGKLPLLASLVASLAQSYTWVPVTPSGIAGPGPRDRPSIGYKSVGQNEFQFFVYAGKSPDGAENTDLWKYDSAAESWSRLCENSGVAPEPRVDAVGGHLSYKGNDYFVLGSGASPDLSTFFVDVWSCDFGSGQWRRLDADSSVKPDGRYGSAGGLLGSKFYISHGFSTVRFSDTLEFDVGAALDDPSSSLGWSVLVESISLMDPFQPHGRCVMGLANEFPYMYMYGGCANVGETGGPCPALDFWRFDVSSSRWERLANGPVPAMLSDLAVLRGEKKIILAGGARPVEDQILTLDPEPEAWDVHEYDLEEDTWTTYIANIPNTWSASSVFAWHKMVGVDPENAVKSGDQEVKLLMYGGSGQEFGGRIYGLIGDGSTSEQKRRGYYFSTVYLHGVFMFLGWGLCLQVGAFSFRYFKHHETKWAWMIHRGAQTLGLVFAVVGFVFADKTGGDWKFGHANIGIAVMALGLFNPLAALFRCHPNEKSFVFGCGFEKRWLFNLVHHVVGRASLLLALVNIALGISMSQAPIGWWLLYIIYVALLLLSYVAAELLRWRGALPRVKRSKDEQYMWGFGDAKDTRV